MMDDAAAMVKGLRTSSGLVAMVGWVREDRLVEAQQALARWAAEPPPEWTEDLMFDFVSGLSSRAEKVVQWVARRSAGRWVPSAEIAEHLSLTTADLGGAVSSIGKQAAAISLPSPVQSTLRRGPDRRPVRHLTIERTIAELVTSVPQRKPAVRPATVPADATRRAVPRGGKLGREGDRDTGR